MRRLALSATTALLTASGVLALPAAQASAATTCVAPVLRETMVSQGLPSYGKLINGKSALVKFFLSLPSTGTCAAASSQSVTITGGTLTVNAVAGGGSVTTINQLVTPTSSAGAQLAPYTTAPTDNIPGDPVFAVPGTALNGTGAAGYNATFSAVLNYTVVDTKRGTTVTTGTTTVPTTPASKPVSVATRPLRLLVVPMGDPSSQTDQLPASAQTAITTGIQALSRQMPVADGVNDLTDTAAAGIKWHLNAGLLNLGVHDEVTTSGATVSRNYLSTGSFCGGSGSFPYISGQLANFLQAWNTENPTAYADRVLGVVSHTISGGPSTGNGNTCAEGYAGVGTPEAWMRAVPPAGDGSRQGISGGLAALELMHTYGGSTQSSTYHSPNTNADGSAPGRAYNVTTRAQLDAGKNRATMHFGLAPWDDYTTLLEQTDFDFETCVLSGGTSCGGAAATAGTVAASGTYVLRGTYDTAATGAEPNTGIDAVTYFDPDTRADGTDASSTYRLIQRDAAGAVLPGAGNTGIRMTKQQSEHHGDDQSGTTGVLTFDVSIPAVGATSTRGAAASIEIWKGNPGTTGAKRLYNAPYVNGGLTITGFTSRPGPSSFAAYTTGGTGKQAAVSPTGSHVAWTSPTGITIAPRTSSTPSSSPTLNGQQVAFRPDGAQVAYVRAGGLYVAPVDLGTSPVTIGGETAIYEPGVLGGDVGDPSYSPDGTKVVVSLGNDLWTIALDSGLGTLSSLTCGLNQVLAADVLPPCARLTNAAGTESQPDWGPNNVIAYTVTNGSSPSEIWTLPGSSTTPTQRVADGVATSEPAWAGSLLLATRPSGIVSYLTTGTTWQRAGFSALGGDTRASGSDDGKTVAFDRASGSDRDVYLVGMGSLGYQVDVSGPNADRYRLDVYLSCPGVNEVIVVGDRPDGPPPAGATSVSFTGTLDPSSFPAGCRLMAAVTNGYNRVVLLGDPTTGGGTANVGIYSPVNGTTIPSFKALAVNGGATDASGKATADVTWTLTGPGGSGYESGVVIGNTGNLGDVRPPAGGWKPGTYTLRACSNGVCTSITVIVTNDADGDGIPDSDDSQAAHPCYPADATTNPSNATTDYDNDGLLSINDPDPCVTRYNATVKFQADSINLGSAGTSVNVSFDTTAISLATLQPSQAVITSIGGYRTSFVATAIGSCSTSSAQIKFSRQALQAFYQSKGLKGYVPIVITVTTSQGTAAGFDPSAPTYTY